MSKYDELIELESKATPGPWVTDGVVVFAHGGSVPLAATTAIDPSVDGCGSLDDVEFITALRNAAPGLIAQAAMAERLAVLLLEVAGVDGEGEAELWHRVDALLDEAQDAGLLPVDGEAVLTASLMDSATAATSAGFEAGDIYDGEADSSRHAACTCGPGGPSTNWRAGCRVHMWPPKVTR